jgi:hypothetical protein
MCLGYILCTLLAKTCVDKFKLSIATTTRHRIAGRKLVIAEGKARLNCIAYFLAKMTQVVSALQQTDI